MLRIHGSRLRSYSCYGNMKKRAYADNVPLYKWASRCLPLALLKRFFPVIGFLDIPRGASVLDIGAGSGLYSHILRQRLGCQCRELEPFLENLYGAQEHVIKKDITQMPLDACYDVILLLDVVEHLQDEDLGGLFESLKVILHDNGSIYIKVPNSSSLAGLESAFGDVTHLQHLNVISLVSLVENSGFSVLRTRGVGPNFHPRRMLLRALSLPFEGLLLAHLKAQGCSGVLVKPSIVIEIKKCP